MTDENSVQDFAGDEAAAMALYEEVMQC